jgi:tetratricopeptide (TPR) repeat protein
MEGSSKKAITTSVGRGTEGYRAPELVRREVKYTYSNKVDMWAIGCIFYEIVVKSKVFPEDWEVVQFAELVKRGRTVTVSLEGHMLPGERRDFISRAIKELLDIDPHRRPRADALHEIFSSWGSDDAPQNSLFSSSNIAASVLPRSAASPTAGGASNDQHVLTTIREMQERGLRYASQGRHREAAQVREEVIEEQKRYLGVDHPDTLATWHALSWSYGFLGRYAEAEQILEEVLEKRGRILGKEHPSTLMTMHNLGWTYSAQGRNKEAEGIQEEVYEKRKRLLGAEDIDTLHAMRNLGSTYQALEKYEESAQMLESVIETRKRILGIEHQHTLEATDGLVLTYHAQGRHEEAKKLEEYLLQKRARILGEEDST